MAEYKCKYCGEVFEKPLDLARHVRMKHKPAKRSAEKAKLKIEDIEFDLSNLRKKNYELPKKVSRYLHNYLLPDERIELSLRGGWGLERRGSQSGDKASGAFLFTSSPIEKRPLGFSWFVITNRRLLITTKGVLTADTRDFSYDKISSIDYEKGILTDRLTIHAMSSVEDIFFYKDVASVSRKLLAIIRLRIDRATRKSAVNTVADDPLKILKMRLARGDISRQEFEDLKQLL
jgi:hypothetical protein